MNIRTLAFSALAVMALSPAAFAGSNSAYETCIGRDKPNNGGIPCEQLRDMDEQASFGFNVQADTTADGMQVVMVDTWPGKSDENSN